MPREGESDALCECRPSGNWGQARGQAGVDQSTSELERLQIEVLIIACQCFWLEISLFLVCSR